MKFSREINRLLIGILIGFGLVGIAATYWAIMGPDTIYQRDDNPRLVEAEAAIVRGALVDRHGETLVESQRGDDGSVIRHYLYPAMNSALGYFSLRYGVGGAEAAYNTILRGDDLDNDNLATYVEQDVLHQPQVGSDIRLTFDLGVQQQVAAAMGDYTGAVVVMSVPDGAVLALVSLPTYDPNSLDADWESLITAPGNPFFNRVLQGKYQPGGLLQTPLMAEYLLRRQPVDTVIDTATRPVQVDDLMLRCAAQPPEADLSLSQAYLFTCPEPFAQLARNLGDAAVLSTIDSFGLHTPATLAGFIVEPEVNPTPATTETPTNGASLINTALGQGNLTVTPLSMAMMTAAVINGGNAPQPYALLERRAPETNEWASVSEIRQSIPFMTADVARQIQALMREAVEIGAAQPAQLPDITTGGHTSVAYSGDGAQAWFIGFVLGENGQQIVTAVVIENSDDPALASRIGGLALQAGYDAVND